MNKKLIQTTFPNLQKIINRQSNDLLTQIEDDYINGSYLKVVN
jgi:hypothetical protein